MPDLFYGQFCPTFDSPLISPYYLNADGTVSDQVSCDNAVFPFSRNHVHYGIDLSMLTYIYTGEHEITMTVHSQGSDEHCVPDGAQYVTDQIMTYPESSILEVEGSFGTFQDCAAYEILDTPFEDVARKCFPVNWGDEFYDLARYIACFNSNFKGKTVVPYDCEAETIDPSLHGTFMYRDFEACVAAGTET